MHILTTHSGKAIQLEWGTYAMFLYCEKKGIDLKGFGEQMASMQFDMGVLISMLQIAVKATGQPEPDIKEACDWIDDCGGMLATTGPLHDFINYVIKRTVLNTSDAETEEKKNQS